MKEKSSEPIGSITAERSLSTGSVIPGDDKTGIGAWESAWTVTGFRRMRTMEDLKMGHVVLSPLLQAETILPESGHSSGAVECELPFVLSPPLPPSLPLKERFSAGPAAA